MHNPSESKGQPLRAMQVYSRGEFRVLPLCSGYIVVDRNGREIDRVDGIDKVEDAIETVDSLVLKEVA